MDSGCPGPVAGPGFGTRLEGTWWGRAVGTGVAVRSQRQPAVVGPLGLPCRPGDCPLPTTTLDVRTLYRWTEGAAGRWLLGVRTQAGPRVLVLYDDLGPARPGDLVLSTGEALPDRTLFGVPRLAMPAELPTEARPIGRLDDAVHARVTMAIEAALAKDTLSDVIAGRADFAVVAAADLAALRR